MKYTLIMLTIFFSYSLTAKPNNFLPAKLLDNGNSKFTSTTSHSREEYWSYSNFIVDPQGIPKNIIILNKTGLNKSNKKTLDYIGNLEYSPAKKGNNPINTGQFFLYSENIGFIGNPNNSFSKKFEARYSEINKALGENQLKDIEKKLSELYEDQTKNLTEQCLYSWLASYYYSKINNIALYNKHLETAYLLRAQVPTKVAYKISMSFFRFKLHNNEFSQAINILTNIKLIEGLKLDKESYEKTFNEVMKMAQNKHNISLTKSLTSFGNNYHQISRNNISLESQPEIDSVELRCSSGFHRFDKSSFNDFTIPESFKQCSLFFIGKPNSTVKIEEKGKLVIL